MATQPNFVFRGSAVGIALRVRRPQELRPEVVASVGLSSIGGPASAHAGLERPAFMPPKLWLRSSFTEHIRYATARVQVDGDFTDLGRAQAVTRHEGAYAELRARAVVSARVTDVELKKRVSIGEASGSLESEKSLREPETAIRPVNLKLDRIRIDGHTVRVEMAERLFAEHDTFDKIIRSLQGGGQQLLNRMVGTERSEQGQSEVPLGPDAEGNIYCTVVARMEWAGSVPNTARIEGNSVVVQDLGVLHFGELLISRSGRRLRMMRATLGSPVGGEFAIADVETNGTFWPAAI